MRCYFFHKGRIAAVALLTPAPDADLISQAEELFRKSAGRFGAFEVWDLSLAGSSIVTPMTMTASHISTMPRFIAPQLSQLAKAPPLGARIEIRRAFASTRGSIEDRHGC